MKDITKEYTNGEITVVWKPKICIHAENCINLSSVFHKNGRPWITPEGATTAQIANQIEKCPSGALSYYYNNKEQLTDNEEVTASITQIDISPNGPIMLKGDVTIKHKDGREEKRTKMTAFCRCGASANKPFCDGSHHKVGFKDE